MQLRIEALGDNSAVERTLVRFGERAMDAAPAFAAIALVFWRTEAEQFDSGGSFSGGWTPLAQSTVRIKERKFLDPRTLIATHALASSLSSAVSPGSVYRVGPHEMFVGTSDPKAKFHQHGTRRMPMRKPVELPEVVKVSMVKLLQNYIVRGEL